MTSHATTEVLVDNLTFPESPRWHDGKLWFSDFYSERVMSLTMEGHCETVMEVPGRPSGLGWRGNRLLVVSMLKRQVLELDCGILNLVADLKDIATGPCNDLVVDTAGNIFVGNFGFDRHAGEAETATCIARIAPTGEVTREAEDMLFPNGMAISPDGKTLIVAESLAARLTAFDLSPEGALTNRRVFASLPGAFPDGICLDAEGAVWTADPWGNRLVRVFEGGRVDRIVSLDARGAYACMLGGPDRRSLFICTSTTVGPAAAVKREGQIEVLRVDVPGAGLP